MQVLNDDDVLNGKRPGHCSSSKNTQVLKAAVWLPPPPAAETAETAAAAAAPRAHMHVTRTPFSSGGSFFPAHALKSWHPPHPPRHAAKRPENWRRYRPPLHCFGAPHCSRFTLYMKHDSDVPFKGKLTGPLHLVLTSCNHQRRCHLPPNIFVAPSDARVLMHIYNMVDAETLLTVYLAIPD
jgi:hypothetical protein